MTVPSRKGPDEYFLNILNVGDRRSITFPFLANKSFLKAAVIKIDDSEQPLVSGTDYELEMREGVDSIWGVFVSRIDMVDLKKLIIWREIPQTQTTPFQTRIGTQLNRDVELGLDKLTMQVQDMNYEDRALRFSPGITVEEIPANVKNKLLGFDGDGNPVGVDPNDLPSAEVKGIAPINALNGTVSLAIGAGLSVIDEKLVADIQQQVNADWNATSGKAQILNKPLVPTVETDSSISEDSNGKLDVKLSSDGSIVKDPATGALRAPGGGGGDGDSPWEVNNGAIVQKDEANTFTAELNGQYTISTIKTENFGDMVTQVHLKSQMNDGSYIAEAFVAAALANTKIDLAVFDADNKGVSLTINKNSVYISKGAPYNYPKEVATADQLLTVNADSSIAKGVNNAISVKHDSSITELPDGALHVAQAQADMEEEDENSPAFVRNKPVIDQIVAGKGLTETNTDIYVGSHHSAALYSRNSIASNGDILVATSETRIQKSVDNGKTWQIVYHTPLGSENYVYDVTYSDHFQKFVAVGARGRVFIGDSNGENWSQVENSNIDSGIDLHAIISTGSILCACGSKEAYAKTNDLIYWNVVSKPESAQIYYDLAYSNGKVALVGTGGAYGIGSTEQPYVYRKTISSINGAPINSVTFGTPRYDGGTGAVFLCCCLDKIFAMGENQDEFSESPVYTASDGLSSLNSISYDPLYKVFFCGGTNLEFVWTEDILHWSNLRAWPVDGAHGDISAVFPYKGAILVLLLSSAIVFYLKLDFDIVLSVKAGAGLDFDANNALMVTNAPEAHRASHEEYGLVKIGANLAVDDGVVDLDASKLPVGSKTVKGILQVGEYLDVTDGVVAATVLNSNINTAMNAIQTVSDIAQAAEGAANLATTSAAAAAAGVAAGAAAIGLLSSNVAEIMAAVALAKKNKNGKNGKDGKDGRNIYHDEKTVIVYDGTDSFNVDGLFDHVIDVVYLSSNAEGANASHFMVAVKGWNNSDGAVRIKYNKNQFIQNPNDLDDPNNSSTGKPLV